MTGEVVMVPHILGPWEYQCAGCKVVRKRGLWSITHVGVPHSFKCDCGTVTWFEERADDED